MPVNLLKEADHRSRKIGCRGIYLYRSSVYSFLSAEAAAPDSLIYGIQTGFRRKGIL